MGWRWLCCWLLFAGPLSAASNWMRSDWGPFYADWTDVHGNEHRKILGPVLEKIETPEGWRFSAVRPFTVGWNNEGDGFQRREILWPVARSTRNDNAFSWRFLLTFSTDWDVTDPESRARLWVLPFWFSGRDKDGQSYRALFPLGGSIREFMFWDEVRFFLFPLRVESRARNNRASSWLWPLISRTEGPRVDRFRIFPLYGYSEIEGLSRKIFVLWPFWTQARFDHPKSNGRGWMLFPIAGHLELTDQESWWILPPFFRLAVGEEQNRLFGPWPFLQRESGQTQKFYLWPLFGSKTIGNTTREFLIWPLGFRERIQAPTHETRRMWFVPFYQYFRTTPVAGAAVEDFQYRKIWPIYSHLRREQGQVQRTVFPDLNPFRRGPIDRNYAPFWQIYTREQVHDAVDTEILWGLWRSGSRGEHSRHRSLFPLVSWGKEEHGGGFSLLKGLLSRERRGDEKQWRVLYLFKFGVKEFSSKTQPTP